VTSQMELQENRVPRASWMILAGVTLFATLNGLWVAITPAGSQTELSGRTWEQFAAAEPEMARIYAMDLVLLGMTLTAFSILGMIVTIIPYRHGERWAWFTLWLIPLVYGGMSFTMLSEQYYDVGYIYVGLFIVSLIGILIPIRRFL
jgi:hypothetical protein